MRRLLALHLAGLLPAAYHIKTYCKDYQHNGPLSGHSPRNDLTSSHRISDLPLDVMRHKCRRIDRHRLDFQTHRLEIKSVHDSFFRLPLQDYLRKLVLTLVKRCYHESCPDVHQFRHALLLLCHLHGVDKPGRHCDDASPRVILPLREGELSAFLDESQFHTVEQLVADEDGIPLLPRSEEGTLHGDYAALRTDRCVSRLHSSRVLDRFLSVKGEAAEQQADIYKCLTHMLYLFLNKVISPLT